MSCQHNRALVLICTLFFCFVQPAFITAGVRVARVKITIDDVYCEWNERGLSAADRGMTLQPETIISFLSVKPGQSAEGREIERRCRESELRLMESGYVYKASVQIVPPRKNPDERTIVVIVTSGFLWRFGGGNAWGVAGVDGLCGERASVRVFAGWNRNGAEYRHYNAFGVPLVLGSSLFWFGPGETAQKPFYGGLTVGWFLHPGVLIALDAVCRTEVLKPGADMLFSLEPYLCYRQYLIPGSPEKYGNESAVGCDIHGFFYPSESAVKGEIAGFIHGKLGSRTVIACKLAAGAASGGSGFDLFASEERSIRSGYTAEELCAQTFAFASAEYRQDIISFTVFSAIDCSLQVFLLMDAALLQGRAGLFDAYGAGARLLLDNPVFTCLTFSYGINHDGNGRFLFCGTAGY